MNPTPGTSQDRGRVFDYELASLIGGQRVRGSGNTVYAKLDAGVGGLIVVSGKHTDAESFRVTTDMLDEAVKAVLGPEAPHSGVDSFVVVQLGEARRRVAVVDLDLLLSWIRTPPDIVPATSQETLRATTRVPPLFRGT